MSASPGRNRFTPPPPPPEIADRGVRVIQPFVKENQTPEFDFRPKQVFETPEEVAVETAPKGVLVSSGNLGLTEAESMPDNPQATLFDQDDESVTGVVGPSTTITPPPPLLNPLT